jgi:predicted Zn finger-like uncharacterized protein
MIRNAMLVTTCPECHTTFRISVGILEKAGGQVRCGRCAHIFDANTALSEIDEPASTAEYSTEFKFHLHPDTESEIEPDLSETDEALETTAELEAQTISEPQADANADAEPRDDEADSTVVDVPGVDTASLPAPAWLRGGDQPVDRKSLAWTVGAVILALALAGQLAHRYRSSLVSAPGVGPALESVYALFGQDVRPAVDLDRYDLLDLTAVAEPSAEEQGWLMIETRVRNEGPGMQPYPHIFVRLLDRWEETVAGRYFAPGEYMINPVRDGARMNAGSTVDAQFIIIDPGPSATGFELELCVETTKGYQCESDMEQ